MILAPSVTKGLVSERHDFLSVLNSRAPLSPLGLIPIRLTQLCLVASSLSIFSPFSASVAPHKHRQYWRVHCNSSPPHGHTALVTEVLTHRFNGASVGATGRNQQPIKSLQSSAAFTGRSFTLRNVRQDGVQGEVVVSRVKRL